jgi:2-keto-4-pentenoate hydratase/2-oxohepta-3-ene-1,7-dioic acid hydratase in catechol pathway
LKIANISFHGEDRLGAVTERGFVDLILACKKYSDSGLSSLFTDTRTFLESGNLALRLAGELINSATSDDKVESPLLKDGFSIRAPILNPEKILCPAVNYMTHSKESSVAAPSAPYVFGKFANTIIGTDEPILIPRISKKVDYEVELAAVIGKKGKYISKNKVYDYVAGFLILNDVSFRDLQGWPKVAGTLGQNWVRGKGLDSACPIGPYIVTKDELPEPYPLKIELKVNGQLRQSSDTSQQIFKLPDLISHLSEGMTLVPGDIVSTGTPSGVGDATGQYLKEGDIVEATIEKIGTLRNPVKEDTD